MSIWSRLSRTVPPAVPALSVAAARDHLRVEHEADDVLIASLIDAATAMVDGPDGLGVALITQTWQFKLDGNTLFPPDIQLPLAPVQAVTSIAYVDPDHATQTLDPALYTVLTDRRPAIIERAPSATLPAIRRQLGAVTITFTAGYGANEASVPADLRAALLLMVGHLYGNREAVGRAAHELPMGWAAITERYRVGRFG